MRGTFLHFIILAITLIQGPRLIIAFGITFFYFALHAARQQSLCKRRMRNFQFLIADILVAPGIGFARLVYYRA